MTAKEQGLPELPQTPFCLRQHDETGRTTITDGPIDPILWQRWNKVSSLYTADQMRAYALAALVSDTGERGVVDELEKLLHYAESEICQHDETHRGGAIWEICDGCGAAWADDKGGKPAFKWPAAIESARAALRAQPAGGGLADAALNRQMQNAVARHDALPDYLKTTPPESGGQGEAAAWMMDVYDPESGIEYTTVTLDPGSVTSQHIPLYRAQGGGNGR